MSTAVQKFGLLALLAVPACTASSNNGIRPLRPLELATTPYLQGTRSALTGSLSYENNCLLFREQGSGRLFFPIWPRGSIFNGTSVIFHEPGKADQPILVAQQFVMEGQRTTWTGLRAGDFAPFERQCGSAPFIVSQVRPAD